MFLLFTTMVWFIHALNRNREVNLKFPVSYDYLSEQQAFVTPLPQYITVKVRDTGSNLLEYAKDDAMPAIHLDMRQYIDGNKLYISAEEMQLKVREVLHPNTTMLDITPDYIESEWQQLTAKTVSVEIDADITLAGQCIMTTEPQTSPAEITVYGAPEVLDTIKSIPTEHLRIDNLGDTLSRAVALMLPGTVKSDNKVVTLSACARPFTERRFTMPVQIKGLPEGTSVKLFPNTVDVTANVLQKNYNKAQQSDICVYFNYAKASTDKLVPLETELKSGLWFNVRLNPSSVDYILEK